MAVASPLGKIEEKMRDSQRGEEEPGLVEHRE